MTVRGITLKASLTRRHHPLVMGILNVTPDSFSDGGVFLAPEAAVAQALAMEAAGADLIDLGGESTRPGANPVSVQEELHRVLPVLIPLAKRLRIPISVDTTKAEVADAALRAGASLINEITALRGDPAMAGVIARHKAGVILMHMRGSPRTMQQHPRYHDVVGEVRRFLADATARAQAAGVLTSRIVIDPGIGFGKTLRHNLELLRGLPHVLSLGYPVVLGASRKSFIGMVTEAAGDPSTPHQRSLAGRSGFRPAGLHERLGGSLACVAFAQRLGVHIVRVHDVRETVQCLRVLQAIEKGRA
jgi:dihydropteroate synthase